MQRETLAAEWVIRQSEYFDPVAHEFRYADIEITGEHIADIKQAGSSNVADGVDATGFRCTPGLIHPWADLRTACLRGSSLIEDGVVGVGTICEGISDCLLVLSSLRGLRVTAYVCLNGRPHNEGAVGKVHSDDMLMRIARRGDPFGITFRPLINVAEVTSAQELVDAATMAARLGRGLGVALSVTYEKAHEFRERFYCSEIELLSFLGLLDSSTCLFLGARLGRRDLGLLYKSGASLVPWRAPSGMPCGVHSKRACIPIESGLGYPPYEEQRALQLPATAVPDGECIDPDQRVDGVTIEAARALGMTAGGMISPGMAADLCLFKKQPYDVWEDGSLGALELFSRRRPDAVLHRGVWKTGLRSLPGNHRITATATLATSHLTCTSGTPAVSH